MFQEDKEEAGRIFQQIKNTRKKSYEYKQFPSYNIYYVSLDIIK